MHRFAKVTGKSPRVFDRFGGFENSIQLKINLFISNQEDLTEMVSPLLENSCLIKLQDPFIIIISRSNYKIILDF